MVMKKKKTLVTRVVTSTNPPMVVMNTLLNHTGVRSRDPISIMAPMAVSRRTVKATSQASILDHTAEMSIKVPVESTSIPTVKVRTTMRKVIPITTLIAKSLMKNPLLESILAPMEARSHKVVASIPALIVVNRAETNIQVPMAARNSNQPHMEAADSNQPHMEVADNNQPHTLVMEATEVVAASHQTSKASRMMKKRLNSPMLKKMTAKEKKKRPPMSQLLKMKRSPSPLMKMNMRAITHLRPLLQHQSQLLSK